MGVSAPNGHGLVSVSVDLEAPAEVRAHLSDVVRVFVRPPRRWC